MQPLWLWKKKVLLLCVCVCVVLVIQHAIRKRHFVICGLFCSTIFYPTLSNKQGHAVVQLVEALSYKAEGRGFDSRQCRWNFLLT